MKTCIIFGAGVYDAQQPATTEGCLVIAADGGYAKCRALGVAPDLVIGDFDSLGFAPQEGSVVKLPVEKDVTDLDAAAGLALERGCTEIRIYGGMGGRPDHTMANYALLARLSKQGVRAYLYGEGYAVAAVTDGSLTLTGGAGETISVFAWSDAAEGVTLRGLQYPLEDAVLTNTFALGVSNSFAAETAEVSVKRGTLLVMREKKDWVGE